MKVYQETDTGPLLIGRADVQDEGLPYFDVVLFGATSSIVDRFTISVITLLPPGGGDPATERVLLLSPLQRPEVLPAWQPLAS